MRTVRTKTGSYIASTQVKTSLADKLRLIYFNNNCEKIKSRVFLHLLIQLTPRMASYTHLNDHIDPVSISLLLTHHTRLS
jgi:hypothetical protein